jgi:uncharacterized protein (TIGR02996 family)
MTPQDAFLQEIIAHLDDDAPRLIYADWLEEHVPRQKRGEQMTEASKAEQIEARTSIDANLAVLLRDVFDNPFRSTAVDLGWLAWNQGTIPRLAWEIYEERYLPLGTLDGVRLALLADMLEDAGCTEPQLLEHCRSAGPHLRGCWALDLILARR